MLDQLAQPAGVEEGDQSGVGGTRSRKNAARRGEVGPLADDPLSGGEAKDAPPQRPPATSSALPLGPGGRNYPVLLPPLKGWGARSAPCSAEAADLSSPVKSCSTHCSAGHFCRMHRSRGYVDAAGGLPAPGRPSSRTPINARTLFSQLSWA